MCPKIGWNNGFFGYDLTIKNRIFIRPLKIPEVNFERQSVALHPGCGVHRVTKQTIPRSLSLSICEPNVIAQSSLHPNLEPPHPPKPRRPHQNPNLQEPELKTRGTNCKQPRLGGSPATQD